MFLAQCLVRLCIQFLRQSRRLAACYLHALFAFGTWTLFLTWSLAVTCLVYLAPEENELEFSGDDFRTIFYVLRLARCDSGYMFVRLNVEAFQMVSHISYVQVVSVS